MRGESQKLYRFFEGAEKRFLIPLYQRNYDWKEDNCRQLFSDLVNVHTQNKKSHFFGSIVSSIANEEEDVRLIIDGQQRITTVSILLIAMIKAAQNGDLKYNDAKKIDYIKETYLIDKYNESERKVKLKPIKNDMAAFDALLFKEKDEYITSSNITRNFLYFYDRIHTCGLKLEDLLEAVRKLEVINIRLGADDDAQLIFESLNSTGLDLSEADKIRNFLLMSLSAEDQEKCYVAYWNKIEIATGYQPTMFIRDYLTIKTRKIAKIEKLYFEMKQYLEISGLSRQELMADMLKYAEQYHRINDAFLGNAKLSRKMEQLNSLGSTVHLPYLMSLLLYANETGMTNDELYEVLNTIETYWARRIICNLPTNALAKVYATLHNDVLRHINAFSKHGLTFESTYPKVLNFLLIKKQGTSALPSDTEVRTEFKTRNIYHMPLQYKQFLFERMNNGLSKERVDVIGEMKSGNVSIEHIMPQTLTNAWRAELGDDFQRIHETYLHTFANLTLSAYNQQYSNSPFSIKKEGFTDRNGNPIVGFNKSIYSLSEGLRDVDHWTETEIIKRQEYLLSKCLTIWPLPTSDFKPFDNPTDIIVFDDGETELTGRKIAGYTYNGDSHAVTSWKEMLIEVCQSVYQQHKTSFENLAAKSTYHFRCEDQEGYYKIALNVFVFTDNSTWTKMQILKSLFQECGISPDALSFELTPIAKESDNNEPIQ